MIYRITYEGKGKRRKLAHPVKDREELMALRNAKENLELLAKARQGDDDAKAHLLQLAYNIGHVDGLLAGCKSQGSFFFHDVDCYDEQQSAQTKQLILSKKEEIGLVMLERSCSGGWHLVCRRLAGTTILENQVRVAIVLRLEMDTNAKDLQRVSYSTSGSAEDLPYLDDAIFEEPMSAEACEKEYLLLKERERRGKEDLPPSAKKANKHYRPWEETSYRGQAPIGGETCPLRGKTLSRGLTPGQMTPGQSFPREYHGIAFEEILKKYWEINNDGYEPTEGDRDTLTFQLARDLRHICGKNADWLDQVIPCYDGFPPEEKRAKIVNALQCNDIGMPPRLQAVLDAFKTRKSPSAEAEDSMHSDLPPVMPKKLPKLVALLTSRTPDVYKAAVAHAAFPPLATHLCNVRFNYTDNVEHEATLMNCLMAPTGTGKGCIDKPIERIMADITRRDGENTRREAQWKTDWVRKGANKDKDVRPEGLVIQQIDSDMTKPALVTRMDEANGHFVYVKLNELDLFEQLKGQTGKQHFQLMCLAFDPDSEYGQTRVGAQSVTARPKCRFNWNACTTIQKGRRFFSKVLTDGPISRINFCTIPDDEIGCEQPIFKKYDSAFDEQLKPYIDHLTSARGLTDCPQALRLAKSLQKECAEFARLSQDEVYWNLSHRAIIIAWLKACVLYVANGCQWEKTIEDFVRWSLEYDLWCKMRFFGADIARANSDDGYSSSRGPRNLLELLPERFTLEDAKRVRRHQGLGVEKTGNMISAWKSRRYVILMEDGSYQNLKKQKN